MKQLQMIVIFASLTIGIVLVICVMTYQMFMMATYDETEHMRAEFAEEQAKKRMEAIKEMQMEYMEEHH